MSEHEHNRRHEHNHEHDGDKHHESNNCDGAGHEHHHHSDGSCCCHQHEVKYHGVNKPMIARLIVSAVLFFSHELLHDFLHGFEAAEIILFAAVAVIAGYDVVINAFKNLFRLKFFDEYFLMTFASVVAFIIGNYHEGAAVMFLYRVGETCQDYAIRHSSKSISELTGSHFSINERGAEKTRKFISKFAAIYTPVVLILAVLIAVLLPVFGNTEFSDSVYRALTFLVVACPCAVVISVPLTYSAGIGAAYRKGIFFKDSTSVDEIAGGSCHNAVRTYSNSREVTVISNNGSSDITRAELVCFGHGDKVIAAAKSIAVKTRRIVLENIVFTIVIKCAVLILSAFGISSLWFAVFADSGVTVIAILNSLRAFRAPRIK